MLRESSVFSIHTSLQSTRSKINILTLTLSLRLTRWCLGRAGSTHPPSRQAEHLARLGRENAGLGEWRLAGAMLCALIESLAYRIRLTCEPSDLPCR